MSENIIDRTLPRLECKISLKAAVARCNSELAPLKRRSASYNYYRTMAKDTGSVMFKDVSGSGSGIHCKAWKAGTMWVLDKDDFEMKFIILLNAMENYNPPRPFRWWKE